MVEPTSKAKASVSLWVKAFVVFHLLGITVWSLPNPKKPYMNETLKLGIRKDNFVQSFSETVTEGTLLFNWKYLKRSPLSYYTLSTGFWQYWDMFAPNPASIDLYLEADITYRDGSKTRFHYPRIYTLSIPMKYVKERYRKFYENVNNDEQAYIRPAVAQRIALESFDDPANPPVQVVLIRYFDTIEPPGVPEDPTYKSVPYFTYRVDQRKLFRDKGLAPR